MAKVRVTEAVTIVNVGPEDAPETVNVFYPAGFEGTAPTAHIDRIVKAGKGQKVDGRGGRDDTEPAEAPAA